MRNFKRNFMQGLLSIRVYGAVELVIIRGTVKAAVGSQAGGAHFGFGAAAP